MENPPLDQELLLVMKTSRWLFAVVALLGMATASLAQGFLAPGAGGGREAAIVESAAVVLEEIMAIPAKAIPLSLLSDAQGIAIVPGLVKGGFVVGVRHGRGVVVVRDDANGWRMPAFITITGGSIGWQAGIQATDVVLVFKTKKSVQNLMNGKFTIGADAAAAAGPVGRQLQAATDTRFAAEILSYSRSRGLFAGVALDGAALQIDAAANAAYYQAPPGQAVPVPPSAQRLLAQIAKYSRPEQPTAEPSAAGPVPSVAPAGPAATVQSQLAESSRRLSAILDAGWQRYLALPEEVYLADRQPSAAALQPALERYNAVAANPQYQSLAARREFQDTFVLLKRLATNQAASSTLALPPPPAN